MVQGQRHGNLESGFELRYLGILDPKREVLHSNTIEAFLSLVQLAQSVNSCLNWCPYGEITDCLAVSSVTILAPI